MVLKLAVLPGFVTRLARAVALTLVFTVRVALCVTAPHAPLTTTL